MRRSLFWRTCAPSKSEWPAATIGRAGREGSQTGCTPLGMIRAVPLRMARARRDGYREPLRPERADPALVASGSSQTDAEPRLGADAGTAVVRLRVTTGLLSHASKHVLRATRAPAGPGGSLAAL